MINQPTNHHVHLPTVHVNIGNHHHPPSNISGHRTRPSLNIHRLLPKLHQKKKNNVPTVQDLSQDLIPIIGQVKFAAVIHNLFSHQECAELIKMTEKRGYTDALVHGPNGTEILRRDIRNSGRCIIDDEDLAQSWFERMVQALEGSVIKDRLFDAHWLTNHEANPRKNRRLHAVGLNERLRFLRYHPGQYFGIHKDNAFTRGEDFGPRAGEESHLTFLLYLNDKMEGGQTRIESCGRYLDVVPETGSVFVFDHDILHEAIKITAGRKYCCRTDVMFCSE